MPGKYTTSNNLNGSCPNYTVADLEGVGGLVYICIHIYILPLPMDLLDPPLLYIVNYLFSFGIQQSMFHFVLKIF